MALHENDAGGNIAFLNASCGKLHKWNGPNNPREQFAAVDGVLQRLTILLDEGNKEKKIQPFYKLVLELQDGQDKYVVAGRHPSTFSWMLASHLNGISGGDRIKIRVWPGTDIDKVTCCMVDVLSEDGEWVKAKREIYNRDDEEEKYAQATQDIESHEAYVAPDQWRPKKDEEDAVPASPEIRPAPVEDGYDPFAD